MINQKTIDKYINKTFGNLLVFEVYHKKFTERNKTFCKCKCCVCGNENYHCLVSDLKKISSCGCSKKISGKNKIEKHKIKYMGKSYISDTYGEFTIVNYLSTKEVYIKFKNTGNIECISFSHIKDGELKDSHKPKSYNGYFGRGKYKTDGEFGEIAYNKWRWMLTRCYDENFLKRQPTYLGCSVCKEWLNFQSFAEWLENNWYDCGESLELDKDLLVYKNKQYSPKTCCLIPRQINQAIIHKRFDSEYMESVYNKYKEIVPINVKNSLYELSVNKNKGG